MQCKRDIYFFSIPRDLYATKYIFSVHEVVMSVKVYLVYIKCLFIDVTKQV